jgi:membrane fusion protein (multidrug efflux system)
MSAEERNVANEVPIAGPSTGAPPGGGKAQPAATIPSQSAARNRPRGGGRGIVGGGIAMLLVAISIYFGVPILSHMLNTVSTDDAYVNGHVTFVAARVPGQVTTVLVDDNDRVRKGSLIVQLDKEPYQIQVDLKKAALATAEAQLLASEDEVRGQVGLVRGNRFKLQHAIESVDNQIALLRANIAALETRRAGLTRAKADYDRAI